MAARAQVTVDAPVNNSIVNSSFLLRAEAPTCEAQPTANMAYSIDSQADVVFSGTQSLQTMVAVQNTTSGTHVLDVKAWSTTGQLCRQSVMLTVGDGVSVSAPAQGAIVTSPFVLEASAATCGGEATHIMSYEFDSIQDLHENHGVGQPHEISSTALNATVNADTGAYVLRVKARGDAGAYCETDVNLNVATTSGLVPPSGASQFSNLENDQNYVGTYASCGGANGPNVNLWQTQPDCGTVGTKTGNTMIVATPTYGTLPDSREFTMTFNTSGGGVRWFDHKAANDAATHFQYDAYVNIIDVSKVGELELDVNHAIASPTKLVYILAAQCNLPKGLWQVTVRGKGWVNTNAPCTRSQVTSGVWHHFQVQTHHDPNGGTGIYYDAVAIDGNVTPITSCSIASTGVAIPCQSSPSNLGWATLIGPNFQIDGVGVASSATAYVDNFTIYYW